MLDAAYRVRVLHSFDRRRHSLCDTTASARDGWRREETRARRRLERTKGSIAAYHGACVVLGGGTDRTVGVGVRGATIHASIVPF